MSEFLAPDELHQLTGYARAKAQAGWLTREGIPHQVRQGRVIVSREHSRRWLEGRQQVVSSWKPDFTRPF